LLLPPAGSVLVFGALGLGLAIPFLLVAFVPALRNKLPKPGRWMQRLQRFLAIPMAATAIACLWLLYRLAGTQALIAAIIATAVLALILGGWRIAQSKSRNASAIVAAAALVVGAIAVAEVPSNPLHRSGGVTGAEPWSEGRVASELGKGRPVFVYFTADWCLTCKANEAAAIDRDAVRDAFKAEHVTALAGDWTNGDPAITRFLESRGRAGVPYYLWYVPGRPPEELPQILTPAMLISRARSTQR
jgi:thiol:disulfide interchange protein